MIAARVGAGIASRVTHRTGSPDFAAQPAAGIENPGCSEDATTTAPDGRPERLAFQGFFLPTAVVDEQGPRSVFPDALNPAVFLNAWYGPPKVETGVPEGLRTRLAASFFQTADWMRSR